MKDVYSHAGRVLACIGDGKYEDSNVMKFLLSLIYAIHLLNKQKLRVTMNRLCQVVGCREHSAEWKLLYKWLHQPWFMRAWIFQEVLCATQPPDVVYGGLSIKWDLIPFFTLHMHNNGLIRSLVSFGHEPHLEAMGLQVVHNITSISSLRQRVGQPTTGWELLPRGLGTTLEDILFQSSAFVSTDYRDKVFAFLGMASDLDRITFTPDYTESAESIFTKTTSHALLTYPRLTILGLAGIGFTRKLSGIPSWVPDFTTHSRHRGMCLALRYRMSGYEPRFGSRFQVVANSDTGEAIFPGNSVDSVLNVSRSRPSSKVIPDDISITKRSAADVTYWFKQVLAMAKSMSSKADNVYRPTGEALIDAIWRTIIANVDHEHKPVPPEFHEHFVSYIVCMWWILVLGKDWEQPLPDATDSPEFVRSKTGSDGLYASALDSAGNHKFFTTKGGYVGLGPPNMEKDDVLCVLLGGYTPFLLRERSTLGVDGEKRYALVGECYVHGLMNGEKLHEGSFKNMVLI